MFARDPRDRIIRCPREMEMLSVIYVYIYILRLTRKRGTKKFSVRTFWVTAIRERNKRRFVCVVVPVCTYMNASNAFFHIFRDTINSAMVNDFTVRYRETSNDEAYRIACRIETLRKSILQMA